MKRLLLLFACACASKPASAPVSNVASSSTQPAPSGEPSAKVIQRTATGGIVELSGDREVAMKQANEEIGKHCEPAGYVVVQEGEEATTDADGKPTTAWRLHYRCDH